MDLIALYFIGRHFFPLMRVGLDGYRLSFFALPAWLLLAYVPDNGKTLSLAMTKARVVFFGLTGYVVWLLGEGAIGRSPDALREVQWLIFIGLPMYIVGSFYGALHPQRFWKIARTILAFMGIQAAYSLPFLIAGTFQPKDVMHAARIYGPESRYAMNAALRGIGGYDLYMNTCLLIAIAAGLTLSHRMATKKRIFWICVWVFTVMANMASTFTASMVTSIMASMMALVSALFMKSIIKTIKIASMIGLIIIGAPLYSWVASSENFKQAESKIEEIHETTRDGGLREEHTGRGRLLLVSIDTWMDRPFVGYGAQGALRSKEGQFIGGGHSTWLNVLVNYGVLGGMWYYLLVFGVGLNIFRAARINGGDIMSLFYLVAYASFIFFGTINTVTSDVTLLYFLHGGALAMLATKADKSSRAESQTAAGFISERSGPQSVIVPGWQSIAQPSRGS